MAGAAIDKLDLKAYETKLPTATMINIRQRTQLGTLLMMSAFLNWLGGNLHIRKWCR